MSKELEAFRKISKNLNSYGFTDEYKNNKKLIETELKRLETLEHWNEVCEDKIATLEATNKRQSEILRIIKEKEPLLARLDLARNVEEYNEYYCEDRQLTQAEFDLLKEWLK